MNKRGKFIVIEGLDGSGKTTQLLNLNKKLQEIGIVCMIDKEPSDGAIGTLIRNALMKKTVFEPETLALLFAADRYEHVTNGVTPLLDTGMNILCDRYVFSSLAYQSTALSLEQIIEYNSVSINKLMPDLTVFIDASPKVCCSRISQSRSNIELFEGNVELMSIIRKNFFKAFDMLKNKTDVKIIEGDDSEDIVFQKILETVVNIYTEQDMKI